MTLGMYYSNGIPTFFAVVRGRALSASYPGPIGLIFALRDATYFENTLSLEEYLHIQNVLLEAWHREIKARLSLTENTGFALVVLFDSAGRGLHFDLMEAELGLTFAGSPTIGYNFSSLIDAFEHLEMRDQEEENQAEEDKLGDLREVAQGSSA